MENDANGQKGIDVAKDSVRRGGLFAGKSTGTPLILNSAQYLWERVHPRNGRHRSAAKMAGRHAAPALEGMAKAGGLAEAERLGNAVDRHLVLGQQLLGPLEAQLVE